MEYKYMKVFYLAFTLLAIVGCSPSDPQENISAAKEYMAQNKPSAAIIELKNAIQNAPQSAEARFELGKIYLQERQFENAEKELSRAVDFGLNKYQVLPKLAKAYRHTESVSLLSKVDNNAAELSDEDKSEIGYYKLIALTRLDKTSERTELLEQLTTLNTTLPFVTLANANELIVKGEFDSALSLLNKMETNGNSLEELLKLKGNIYLRNSDTENALQTYGQYVENFPEDNSGIFLYASILISVKEFDKAEPYIDQLLKINSQHPLLNRQKSLITASQNDYVATKDYAEKAIQNGSDETEIRLIAGYAAYKLEQYEQAQRHLSRIADELPKDHLGLRILASSQLKLGLTLEANEIINTFGEFSSEDLPLLSTIGFNLLKEGYAEKAAKLVEKTSAISATGKELTKLGVLQLSLDNNLGIANLEKALLDLPDSEDNWQILASAYFERGEYQQVIELTGRWKQQLPREVTAYLVSGSAYTKLLDSDSARSEYEGALKIDPANLSARMSLVYLDLKDGESKGALREVEEILKSEPNYIPALVGFYMVKKFDGMPDEGVKPILKAYKETPESINLKVYLARILIEEKRFPEAIETIGKLEQDNQTPAELWNLKGIALLQSNGDNNTERHFVDWLKLYPTDRMAIIGNLLILDDKKQYSEALKLTDKALEYAEDEQISLLSTYFLVMNRDYTNGRFAYAKLSADIKALPFSKGIFARLQIYNGFIKEALPNARAAYDSQESNRNLFQVIYCLDQLGESDAAYALIGQHVAKYPASTEPMLHYAERQMVKDPQIALQTYITLLTLLPKNPVVLNNLANLYMNNKDFPQAKIYAKQAVKLAPNTEEVWDTLAQIYFKQGDYKNAVESYSNINTDKALQDNIFLNHVEALMASGDNETAISKLQNRTLATPEAKIRSEKLIKEYNI
ncbi:MAG: putative PEP-CTERM system TPR-repeat lipoprotein [Paraglaciecola sp.]|jgi:putative PEP-CTERM system TPR-repeat lipoprotein